MTTLEEKAHCIMESASADFNSLPIEERKRIGKYISYMQILTIWQMLNMDCKLTTEAWRKKQRNWLNNCVERYLKEYGYD